MKRLAIALLALLAAMRPSGALAAPGQTPAYAERVIRAYYAAIERRDYRTAYRCWGGDGEASGKTLAEFTRGFAQTAHSRASVGRARDEEGAAGSSFITVPAVIDAVLKNGRRQRFTGTYILRHVNDVPGSSASERRWHIYQGKLRQVR